MSNITTSYLRFFRMDGKDISKEEIEKLFQATVTVHKEFGSYWVRVLKKYRDLEKCLDIQYGSAKGYGGDDAYQGYYVWERIADEGGFPDQIFMYFYDAEKGYVHTTTSKKCLYQFDKVRIVYEQELPEYFQQFDFKKNIDDFFESNIQGKYWACNDRSFMDLHEESNYYGPRLGYDPHYASDYFVPTHEGSVLESSQDFIQNTFVSPHQELVENMKIELYYNFRLVQTIEKRKQEVITSSADYWDNCADEDFLRFKENSSIINV